MICFEAWTKLAHLRLVCAPLGIHLEPINKKLMLLVDNIIIINCTIWTKKRTVQCQIRRKSLSQWCAIWTYQNTDYKHWRLLIIISQVGKCEPSASQASNPGQDSLEEGDKEMCPDGSQLSVVTEAKKEGKIN